MKNSRKSSSQSDLLKHIKLYFMYNEKGLAGDDQDTMVWAAEYEALKLLEKEYATIERMLDQCR